MSHILPYRKVCTINNSDNVWILHTISGYYATSLLNMPYINITFIYGKISKYEAMWTSNLQSHDFYPNLHYILKQNGVEYDIEMQEKLVKLVMDKKATWESVEQFLDKEMVEKYNHVVIPLSKLNF